MAKRKKCKGKARDIGVSFTEQGHHLREGDVRNIPLPVDAVDLVFTSPPYEAQRTYSVGFNLRGDAWVDWAFAGYVECLRVCSGLVAWVINAPTRNYRWSSTAYKLAMRLEEAGYTMRKPLIFHRHGIPGSGGPDWMRDNYEIILCFTKRRGRLEWSNNTACGHVPVYAPGGEMSYRLKSGQRRNEWGKSPAQANGTCEGQQNKHGERGSSKRKGDGAAIPLNAINKDYSPPKLANPGNIVNAPEAQAIADVMRELKFANGDAAGALDRIRKIIEPCATTKARSALPCPPMR